LRSQNFKVLTPPLLATVSGDARDIQGTERKGWAITEVLAEWLVKQSFPLAVFACNDTRAQQVLNACREGGIRVPDQIAVLGVDNDDVLCDLCEPPLSSIELDAEGLGYRAAALLSRLMQGLAVGDETLSVQTVRLIERVSTDIIAIEDATTVAAMRYIRDHVCEGIATKDVVSHMGCARSNLDVRFHRWLHRSVRAEIHRQRMEIVLRYLEKTDLTIHQIAERTGFATSAHLCRLFQKRFGISPTEHRSKRTTGQLI
jgi:LacI family transcriptional regulator